MEYIKPLNDDAYPERLGAYVNANPSLGIPGSTVPGEALQHTMTEIINAITAAGLTPSDVDLTQLTQAIKQLGTPIGSVLAYPIDDVPVHCLECNGAVISRATYPELFAVIGETYGAGDGSTTFKIPDLRGEFIRGWDNTRGIDGSRAIGTAQVDTFKSHRHRFEWNLTETVNTSPNNYFRAPNTGYVSDSINQAALMTIGLEGTTETRPRNVAMMYCIVYE